MSEYSGEITQSTARREWPIQTERQHAQDLLRRFAFSLGLGIDKIFWAQLPARFGYGGECGNYFDSTGLIYDGHCGPEAPGTRKLAYYTYKIMTDKLDGCDFEAARILDTQQPHTHAVHFPRAGGDGVTVAWWDDFAAPEAQSVTVTLPLGEARRLTVAVATAETGAEVNADQYPAFFETRELEPESGQITFALGPDPVFIE